MTTLAVVQARTGSTRLPGKVLADVDGRPMLAFMLERLARLRVDRLVVATSDLARDDPIVEVVTGMGLASVRGPESDVLARFRVAMETYPSDVVVRMTADCPLIDPEVVERVIERRQETGADYASNTIVRTFPDGLDVEVFTATALREAAAEAVDPYEREHVTPFIYWRPERYRLAELVMESDASGARWTVDTAEDLEHVRTIVAALPDPVHAGWREILAASASISR